jgi:hypothetical protein
MITGICKYWSQLANVRAWDQIHLELRGRLTWCAICPNAYWSQEMQNQRCLLARVGMHVPLRQIVARATTNRQLTISVMIIKSLKSLMPGLHPWGCESSVGDRVSTKVTKTAETENQKIWSDFMERSFFFWKKTNLFTMVKTGFDEIKTDTVAVFLIPDLHSTTSS